MTNPYFSSYSALPRNQLARAEALNAIFDAIIVGFNGIPDATALTQDRLTFCTDTGAAGAYVIAPATPIVSYDAGQRFSFIATNANAGASTVNVSLLGVKTIKRQDGTDLQANDITVGRLVWVQYDGTNFQLMSMNGSDQVASAASAAAASVSQIAAAASASAASASATAANGSAVAAAASAASVTGVFTFSGANAGMGMTPVNRLDITQHQNSSSLVSILNGTGGTAATAGFRAFNGTTALTMQQLAFGYTTSGVWASGDSLIYGQVNLAIASFGQIRFAVNDVKTQVAMFGGDGSFVVGSTSQGGTIGNAKCAIEGSSAGSTTVQYTRQSGTGYAHTWRCDDAGSAFLNLTFNGTTQIGSISLTGGGTGVAFNTSSDVRLKDKIVDAPDQGALIDAIKVREFVFKAQPEITQVGFVAQELFAVFPHAVNDGDYGEEIEDGWGVDMAKLVPLLVKEAQALRARVAILEARP